MKWIYDKTGKPLWVHDIDAQELLKTGNYFETPVSLETPASPRPRKLEPSKYADEVGKVPKSLTEEEKAKGPEEFIFDKLTAEKGKAKQNREKFFKETDSKKAGKKE